MGRPAPEGREVVNGRATHPIVERAERLDAKHAQRLADLCRLRLEDWRKTFSRKFPRQHGSISFGMGSELVKMGGRQINSWDGEKYRSVRGLLAAIEDVIAITDGYTRACPEDFEW